MNNENDFEQQMEIDDIVDGIMADNEKRVQEMASNLVKEIIKQEHARIAEIVEDYFGSNPMTQEIIDLIKGKSPNV